MLFSYNWLKQLVPHLPYPPKTAELLMMKAFEVERIEKKAGDTVLEVKVLANRAADCSSHWGMARELAAILGTHFTPPQFSLKEHAGSKTKEDLKLVVKDSDGCPRYTGRVIKGVKIQSSPQWLKDALQSCGMRSVNNVVDAAHYVMLETGQPFHIFDMDKVEGGITVRKAQEGEKFIAFDGIEYSLIKGATVICDNKSILALAGIKGAKKAEITEKTQNIILESANFTGPRIRATSRNLRLRTDSSVRFENRLDPAMTARAADRLAWAIDKVAGGKISQGMVDFYPRKFLPKKIILNVNKVESILSLTVQSSQIKKILERLDIKLVKSSKDNITFQIPTFRGDLVLPEDLMEELGRMVGYDTVEPTMPILPLSFQGPSNHGELLKHAQDFLATSGFSEIYTYSFIGDKDIFQGCSPSLEIENPVSADLKYLKPTLVPTFLQAVTKNLRYFDSLRLFEIAKVFSQEGERTIMGGLITGENSEFVRVKGVIKAFLDSLRHQTDASFVETRENLPSFLDQKRSLEIQLDKRIIGTMGYVKEDIRLNYGIQKDVVVFELNFDLISKMGISQPKYQRFSVFPSSSRDIAVVMPKSEKYDKILRVIKEAGGPLLNKADLFDVYYGKELEAGNKSLAFHLIFQSHEKTLSSKEVENLTNNIIKSLESEGFQIRQ